MHPSGITATAPVAAADAKPGRGLPAAAAGPSAPAWDAATWGGLAEEGPFPSLSLPPGLLDDIPLLPLPMPEDMWRTTGGACAPPAVPTSAAASGSSITTQAPLPLPSGAQAVPLEAAALWQQQQQQQWAAAGMPAQRLQQQWQAPGLPLQPQWGVEAQLGAALQQQRSSGSTPGPALSPMFDQLGGGPVVMPALAMPGAPGMLAAAQGMLRPPGLVAAGLAPPLVGYGRGAACLPAQQPQLETMTRVSLKVFKCTPDQLLPAVRQELEELLQVCPLVLPQPAPSLPGLPRAPLYGTPYRPLSAGVPHPTAARRRQPPARSLPPTLLR